MKKTNRFFLLLLVYHLIFFMASGCATLSVREPLRAYYVEGLRYYDLDELCRINRIDWSWDHLSGVANLKKKNHSVKVMPHSRIVLFDKQAVDLEKSVVIRNSRLLVPESFKLLIIEKLLFKGRRVAKYPYSYRRVVIDAGHGGKDPGAISSNGLQEKDVVLDIARRLEKKLEQEGVYVTMTRDTDIFLALEERTEIANASRADLFISIHANANHSQRLSGIEIYYFPEMTRNRTQALRLAGFISKDLRRFTGLRYQGAKGADFSVLRSSSMPALLLEIGYLSNRKDERKLAQPDFRAKIARGLSRAIRDFFLD